MVRKKPVAKGIVNLIDIRKLKKRDRVFVEIAKQYGNPPDWRRKQGFVSLCRIILEQQVSLSAANAHYLKLRMSAPKGVTSIEDLDVIPGRVLFRSRVFLFGFIPVDHSNITLIEFEKGSGFVEQSPMGSMRLWRHERRITPGPGGSRIIDRLAFEPETASSFIGWFIRIVFKHRHRVLRKKLDLR